MNVQTVPYQEQVTTARVVLKNVSWQTFKALLADIGDSRAARIAYDQENGYKPRRRTTAFT